MSTQAGKPASRWRWPLLLGATVALMALFEWMHLPAAPLLGAIIAGIVTALAHDAVEIPRPASLLAQGLLGCMISRVLHADIFTEIAHDWPLFLGMTLAVVGLSMGLGWLLAWKKVLPGSTAVWGSAPGAATAMMLMAQAYGADARLTAFMQYLRVVMVAAVASVISMSVHAGPRPAVDFFPALHAGPFALALAISVGGVLLAKLLNFRAGTLLLPMIGGIVAQVAFGIGLELPPWLLLLAYAVLGWNIGLRFTLPLLKYAFAALPKMLLSIAALLAACGGLAFVLHLITGRDAMTAYLATSPGGADSVAIIAASSHVDVAFVMAMQVARFMLVLLIGPSVARWVVRSLPAEAAAAALG